MKKYVSVVTGLLALGIEVMVFLSPMEMPPFGKGSSDIIWGLPFFGLIVLSLAVPGFFAALTARKGSEDRGGLVAAALIANGLSLAIPALLLLLGLIRVL